MRGSAMADERWICVPEGLDGERADAAMSRLFGLSRSQVVRLIETGQARIDGEAIPKSARVRAGAVIEAVLPGPQAPPGLEVIAEPVPGMRIVHDDADIVVVDKPAGVAAHPSVGWSGPTVVGGLRAAGYRVSTSGAPERQGIVSRLDAGTSGLMVVAKSEHAYTLLKRAFRDRRVDKTYHALVQGLPDPLAGTIDAPIGRHPAYDYKYAVMRSGKPSITHYEVIEAFREASLVTIKLETGRTHQIRVHFAAVGHPCAGDPLYGGDPRLAARLGLERQWLHAMTLGFEHPGSGSYVEFTSTYPEDLEHALGVLADG